MVGPASAPFGAYVGPSWLISTRAKKWETGAGPPMERRECRTAVPRPGGFGPLAGFFEGLRLTAGRRPSNDFLAYGVGRLGRDSPRKPREGYVELRQA